jgi:radical SAM protein with 4Fe4S-binding SPASM domain
MRAVSVGRGRRKGVAQGKLFVLQWHVTARCGEECKHCYAKDSPDLGPQIDDELPVKQCLKVLDSFDRFLKGNGLVGRINLTGGDPLLKDGLLELITAARSRGIKVGLLGNPGSLDTETAMRLKEAGVFRYQLSIDGLRATHDRLRGRRGHFDDTLRALEALKEAGLPSVVMFTLSKENFRELPAVARLAAERNVKVFDFARLVPLGRGRGIGMLSPTEFREVLVRMLDAYRALEAEGFETYFGRKEALWALLYSELGLFEPPRWDGRIHSGCSAGSKVLTVLADGTVYPCRRLPIPVGKVPQDDVARILFNARAHVELRDVSRLKKCRGCGLLPYCRGCPAVAFGASGDPFAPDPQCWKEMPERAPATVKPFKLGDHAFWARSSIGTRPCAQCDGACGGCAHVCAACSEVCASCSGDE